LTVINPDLAWRQRFDQCSRHFLCAAGEPRIAALDQAPARLGLPRMTAKGLGGILVFRWIGASRWRDQ